MEKDIRIRIDYLKKELAARGRQDGWVIEGFKKELERLETKLQKSEIKK
jgi:hypothetical protein